MPLSQDYVRTLASSCRATSDSIAKKAQSHERNKTLLDLASVLLGLFAFIVELAPDIKATLGEGTAKIVSTAAASFLVISVGIERTIFKDPPSRFRDYAYYIGSFASKLTSMLAESESPERDRRIDELCSLAENNLEEARRHWPELIRSS